MPTTIYNTIPFTNYSFDAACVSNVGNCYGPVAISFSTLATTTSLHRVGMYLFLANVGLNGTIKVSLLANDPAFIMPPPPNSGAPNGIAPGAVLVDLGSINDTALTAGFETFYFPANFALSPATRYWIMMTDVSISGQVSGAGLGWVQYATASSAVGIAGEYFWNWNASSAGGNWGPFPNTDQGPYQVQVDVNP